MEPVELSITRCRLWLPEMLGMRRSVGRCKNTYVLMHTKFALASGVTHMRATEHVDSDSMSRYYQLWHKYPKEPKGNHSERYSRRLAIKASCIFKTLAERHSARQARRPRGGRLACYSVGRCRNTCVLMHAEFALAFCVTHMRMTAELLTFRCDAHENVPKRCQHNL